MDHQLPQFRLPQYGPPKLGAPQYGPPKFGAPRYGPPKFGAPQYGPLQYGAPQYEPPNLEHHSIDTKIFSITCANIGLNQQPTAVRDGS